MVRLKLKKMDLLSKSAFFQIIQKTFTAFSGMLLASSLFTLIIKFPLINWNDILDKEMLDSFLKISSIGFDYVAIFVVFTFTYYFFQFYNSKNGKNVNVVPVIILNLSLFLTSTFSSDVLSNDINSEFMSSKGVFGALVISYFYSKVYILCVENKLYVRMPGEVPQVIADSFLSFIPMVVCISLCWLITFFLRIDILNITNELIGPFINISDGLLSVILIPILNRLLWFFGIHGAAIINSLISPIMTIMNTSNLEAFINERNLPYTISGNFFSCYVWIGIFPICIALLTTKNKQFKSVGLAGLIPTLFNIDESILFGVPIILNPILFIPFILSGVVPSVLSYIAIVFKIIPIPVLSIPWTVPAPIKAFLATNNDYRAFLWVLFLWVVIYLMFIPFLNKNMKSLSVRGGKNEN